MATVPDAWVEHTLADSPGCPIRISNPSACIPNGLDIIKDFLSTEDVAAFMEQADKRRYQQDGFEQKKRKQHYSLREGTDAPEFVMKTVERFQKAAGRSPTDVSIEEYPRSQLNKSATALPQTAVTTFESKHTCQCNGPCSCFSAQVSLFVPAVEHINRPKNSRQADCWDLYSPNHATGLVLETRSMYIKTDECLWEWRSRIYASLDPPESDGRVVLLKFYRLPDRGQEAEKGDNEFGYVPGLEDAFVRSPVVPSIEEILTLIVTTSPIKSNPSTELLERVFATFVNGGEDFAMKCRKIIVCDGFRKRDETVSKRHTNVKQAMRNGIVDEEQALNYNAFKTALRKLCNDATVGSPFHHSTILELESRHGYGFALREALDHVETPFVIVIQHDRTFMRPTPIYQTLCAMWRHPGIKYVGMNMRSNLLYRDIFAAKYGRSYMDQMTECILRPSELLVGEEEYGPDSRSIENMNISGTKLRNNVEELQKTYMGSQHYSIESRWRLEHPIPDRKQQMSLTPTFFWYDNVHVVETSFYRDFVFNPKYKMVVRGGFVEDKLSPVIRKTVERLGLKEGHSRFGCYLLDDHSGFFFTGHMDGGSYFTEKEKEQAARKRNEDLSNS